MSRVVARKYSDLYYDKKTTDHIKKIINSLHHVIYGKEPINFNNQVDFFQTLLRKKEIIIDESYEDRDKLLFFFTYFINNEIDKIYSTVNKLYYHN